MKWTERVQFRPIFLSPLFLLIVLTFASVTSCGFGPIGYGVMLLSPNGDVVTTGAVVEVEEKSSLNETYTIAASDGSELVEIDMWRVAFFDKREKAEDYAEAYEEYVDIYAKNTRDGLAVREKPDVSSPRVYKMRKGQEVKILDREEEQVTVGSQSGYWYEVLTKDGAQGYCFDPYLKIYDIDAAPVEDEAPDLSRVREVLERTYRPVDFELMQEKGHIKLDKFSEDYGFFPYPEEKRLEVKTFDYSHSFEYEEIEKQSERSYLFSGSGVELRIDDEKHITLIYTKEDRNYSPGFVLVENIEEIREKEMERRRGLLEELVERGPSYHSSAYGTIRFSENGSFTWERFERLVPRIIPQSSRGRGDIRFDHFVGSEVGGAYKGAFSLDFTGTDGKPPVFLYALDGGKLTLEYVSERNIENRVVLQRNASPLIMAFFSQS